MAGAGSYSKESDASLSKVAEDDVVKNVNAAPRVPQRPAP